LGSSYETQLSTGAWDGNDVASIRSIKGNVFAIGGSLNDTIDVIDSKLSIVIGDFGQLSIGDDSSNGRDLSVIRSAGTSNDNIGGGYDQLSSLSQFNGTVRSILMGGSLDDSITSNGRCSVQCGDQCYLQAQSMVSSSTSIGGNDQLNFIGNHQVSIHVAT
jgi:hypothetical protein